MGEVVRLSKRLSYLEDQLKNIQPVQTVAEVADVASLELSIVEELKKEIELLKVNASSNNELEILKQEVKNLKDSTIMLQHKIQELEQSTAGMLDRVLTLKEKLEPNMNVSLLEARVMALEERCVNCEVVGIGSS